MGAYCTDGQVRRAWPHLAAATLFDALMPLREEASGEIDSMVGNLYPVPFNSWVRISSLSTNDITVVAEDVGLFVAGDAIGWYDTSEKKLGVGTMTIVSISGNVITVDAAAESLLADDEIAVVTVVTVGERTVTKVGPPREVEQCSIGLAAFMAHTRITDLEEPPAGVVDGYERALAFLGNVQKGVAFIQGAAAYSVGGLDREDYHPAFDMDMAEDDTSLEVDDDLLDYIEEERA